MLLQQLVMAHPVTGILNRSTDENDKTQLLHLFMFLAFESARPIPRLLSGMSLLEMTFSAYRVATTFPPKLFLPGRVFRASAEGLAASSPSFYSKVART